jgi:hypothetical protein
MRRGLVTLLIVPFVATGACNTGDGGDAGDGGGDIDADTDVGRDGDGDLDADSEADGDPPVDADGVEDAEAAGPCDGIGCSGHGRCEARGPTARCICDTGYRDVGLTCVPVPAGRVVRATVHELVASDTSQGWSSIRYVPSLRRFLSIFINHYSPGGWQDNSLRAFDPETSTVEYLHPKDVPGAPQDRDNHQMLYVPRLDQVWIISGSGGLVLDVAAAYAARDVPPSYGAVGWSGELDGAELATAFGVTGWPDDFMRWNAVVDWHAGLDVGVIWSGVLYTGMGVRSDLFVLRPDEAGTGYLFVDVGNFDDVVTPGAGPTNYIYEGPFDGRHNGRILGEFFYTLSLRDANATADPSGGFRVSVDLWRYDLSGPDGRSAFVAMAPLEYHTETDGERWGMSFPCVTADTRLDLLFVYLALPPPHNLWAYLPDEDGWVEVEADTPAGYRRLAACDYSPDHGLHVYQDGQTDRTDLGWGTIALERSE